MTTEDMRQLESIKKNYKELNRMYHLAQTPQTQEYLSNMISQNQDELFELIDKINLRHTVDFTKPSWINDNRYV